MSNVSFQSAAINLMLLFICLFIRAAKKNIFFWTNYIKLRHTHTNTHRETNAKGEYYYYIVAYLWCSRFYANLFVSPHAFTNSIHAFLLLFYFFQFFKSTQEHTQFIVHLECLSNKVQCWISLNNYIVSVLINVYTQYMTIND